MLNYTTSKEKVYYKREWKSVPAKIDGDTISAVVPEGAHQFFISAYEKDSRFHDLCGSSQPVVLPFPKD